MEKFLAPILYKLIRDHPDGIPIQVQISKLIKEIRELISGIFKGDPIANIAGLLVAYGLLYLPYIGVGAPNDVVPFDVPHAAGLAAAGYKIYEKTKTLELDQYKYQMTIHVAQLKKLLIIQRAIYNSIKDFPALVDQCTQPLSNFMGTDLHFTLNQLTAAARNITHAEMEQLSNLMAKPFQGGAIETFNDNFNKLAAFYLLVTGAAMAEHEQVRLFLEAISTGPYASTFANHVARYNRDRPLAFGAIVAGNQRTLAPIQATIVIAYNSMSFTDKESVAAANAASIAIQADTLAEIEEKASRIRTDKPKRSSYPYSPPTLTPEKQRQHTTRQDIEKLVAQAVAKQATLPKPKSAAAAAKQRNKTPPRSPSPSSDASTTHVCVYHGPHSSHTSSDCKHLLKLTPKERDAAYKKYYTKA